MDSVKSSVICCWPLTYSCDLDRLSPSSCWHICDLMSTKAVVNAEREREMRLIPSASAAKREETVSKSAAVPSPEKKSCLITAYLALLISDIPHCDLSWLLSKLETANPLFCHRLFFPGVQTRAHVRTPSL